MRGLLSVALLFSLNACYVYEPIGSATPDPGKEIRAHLSPVRDFDVGTVTVRDVTRVDGIVYGVTSDWVAVWSNWLYSSFGTRYNSGRAVYYLPLTEVAGLEERRLHPARSVIGVGIGVGLMAAFLNFVADVGGNPGSEGGGGTIQLDVAPPTR